MATHPVSAESRCAGLDHRGIEKPGDGSFFIVANRAAEDQLDQPPAAGDGRQAGDGVLLVSREGHAQEIASLFGTPLSTI